MNSKKWLVATSFLLISSIVSAQNFKNEFGFKSDNDSYLAQGSDRYYTNGLFINFRHALDQSKLKDGLEKKIYEISVGQKMYNPISGYAPDPDKQDRPFAGYLYAGAAMSWFHSNESILKTSAEIGTTGPNSLAEDGQELLHKTVGFYALDGWQYQIKNELALNLSASYTRLLHRAESKAIDFSFEGYANAGTTFSGAGLGLLFRAGGLNQLFNSAYTNAVIGNNAKTKALVKHEVFFYAKPQLNFVAYDATVQGSMFNNNSPVTFGVKPIVFAQQVGFNYSSQRFTFDFGMIFKTKEIKSTAKAHQYGSITMFYRFN
ncbi:lipid A deacylase LpxR family protein [Pedobacter sp. MC2016-24]|uniref:lipid A deacylase LpxR family protein n=1 Tax=Pedobacter sp. MC2016-24 TaxID=2780090 RepID=UPI00187EBEF9|nr:lipid A deacylase LpxR family protein [Pedobacter sp. MC2016-24]MBE9601253.1 lipid A deacylase LpxR family protein [Pedobacter sp. MC2016-24]